jgi:hypothetical protein
MVADWFLILIVFKDIVHWWKSAAPKKGHAITFETQT